MTPPGRPVMPRARTAREAVRLVTRGAAGVILVVPGWLHSAELRSHILKRVSYAASALRAGPVHARWVWLRDDGQGRQQTAFLVWPCTMIHPAGFKCLNGRAVHGNAPLPGWPEVP